MQLVQPQSLNDMYITYQSEMGLQIYALVTYDSTDNQIYVDLMISQLWQ